MSGASSLLPKVVLGISGKKLQHDDYYYLVPYPWDS